MVSRKMQWKSMLLAAISASVLWAGTPSYVCGEELFAEEITSAEDFSAEEIYQAEDLMAEEIDYADDFLAEEETLEGELPEEETEFAEEPVFCSEMGTDEAPFELELNTPFEMEQCGDQDVSVFSFTASVTGNYKLWDRLSSYGTWFKMKEAGDETPWENLLQFDSSNALASGPVFSLEAGKTYLFQIRHWDIGDIVLMYQKPIDAVRILDVPDNVVASLYKNRYGEYLMGWYIGLKIQFDFQDGTSEILTYTKDNLPNYSGGIVHAGYELEFSAEEDGGAFYFYVQVKSDTDVYPARAEYEISDPETTPFTIDSNIYLMSMPLETYEGKKPDNWAEDDSAIFRGDAPYFILDYVDLSEHKWYKGTPEDSASMVEMGKREIFKAGYTYTMTCKFSVWIRDKFRFSGDNEVWFHRVGSPQDTLMNTEYISDENGIIAVLASISFRIPINEEHELTYHNAVNPTCTKAGNPEYWECPTCERFYKDSEATELLTTKERVIKALGHAYESAWTIDKKASFTADGSKSHHCTRCTAKNEKTTIPKVSDVKLAQTSYVYDGKIKKPAVAVKNSQGVLLKLNTAYTLNYASGRTNVGKYTVKVSLKGKQYSGTKTLSFVINPKGTALSVLSPVSKGFTAKWNRQAAQTSGYELSYSLNKQFTDAKTVTITKNTTLTKKVTRLSGGKNYYVRIRTYKTVGNVKYYSAWSAIKNVTTK